MFLVYKKNLVTWNPEWKHPLDPVPPSRQTVGSQGYQPKLGEGMDKVFCFKYYESLFWKWQLHWKKNAKNKKIPAPPGEVKFFLFKIFRKNTNFFVFCMAAYIPGHMFAAPIHAFFRAFTKLGGGGLVAAISFTRLIKFFCTLLMNWFVPADPHMGCGYANRNSIRSSSNLRSNLVSKMLMSIP